MFRFAFTPGWLLLCIAAPLQAQSQAVPDSADVLVLDHDFAAMGELAWIFLKDRQVYRVELSSSDILFTIRPRFSGTSKLRVYSIRDSKSASGGSVYEIYPDQDGEYEIRASGVQGSRMTTRMRVYRDITESRRRYANFTRPPGWELGMEIAGGWHSGFAQSSGTIGVGSTPPGGTDIEACFSARNAPRLPRLNMCVMGVSYQTQHEAPSIAWLYTEPRVRVLGRTVSGRSNWEVGVLLRFGVGIKNRTSEAPTVLGPGFYLARHIRTNPKGSGWSLQLSYMRAFYHGFARPVGAASETPESNRLTFGLGWYQ